MEHRIMSTAMFPGRGSGVTGRPRGHRLFIAAGLLLALAGCKTTGEPIIVGSVPDDYRTNHPIAIDEAVQTMDIPVGINSARLPDGVKANIQGFAQKYRASGADLIAIVTPSGSPNQDAAAYASYEVQDALIASGVNPRSIDFRVYRAQSGENTAPIRLAYAGVTAQTAPCGPWPDQVARNGENRHYANYGCATQQNLAAIVADPLDLLYPRGMTPADAARRATVLNKYRAGEPYTSDYSRETSGTVAKGVGN
jgi:pilus assembly protein CpaD